jgi:hypothetical protein
LYNLLDSGGLTRRRRAYIRLAINYEVYMDLVTALGLASCSLILALGATFPGLMPWAWIPAGVGLLVGLAGLVYPVRAALFWLLSRFV